ncbi:MULTISPECIES: molecular chaperone DnaJ [Shewanella]|uniref:molecular chaperone DnaJ n=1 Tax=Shewanella TaxID=22 RepID=UPI0011840EA4|nr:molecular chaperone DnaJ [Shewanella algae]MBO2638665.1 molecular chaperone DnaJ [Shewanella algae]MCE9775313.1 molecular chaperone DnaJ [Shewanella algae]WKC41279.1 molecular chaperone DnaJ [Shewanella algae]HDS1201531.1 molecular chaperone DnaJ [Shewanella algae]
MQDVKVNLYDCKHCSGTGTCSSGKDNTSCEVCAKKNELPFWRRRNQHGLLCGSCGGIGKAEPLTERMNKRIAPLLAISLVIILLGIIGVSALFENKYFSEILAFSGAIIGSVCGFYFSAIKSQS